MRKVCGVVLVTLLVVAVVLSGAGCSLEETPEKQAAKQQPKLTPEQQKLVEEGRKRAEESKKIAVARVNGHDIAMNALVREMNVVAPKLLKPGEKATPEINKKIRDDALDRLIVQELAIEEAKKQGLTVKPEAIDQTIQKTKASVGGEEQFKEYLKDQALSEEEFRTLVERHLLSQMIVAKEVYSKISLDEKAMKAEYAKHKDFYVKDGTPPVQMTFEEAKPIIEHKLKAEIGAKKIREWGDSLKKTAKVEVFLDHVEKEAKERAEKSGSAAK
jgi:SurA-like N-terminal domain